MPQEIRFAVVMALVFMALIMLAVVIVWHLRKRLFKDEGYDEEEDALYTTAQLESLKREGLINEEQYARLQEESREAAKRRAQAARERKAKKTRIFD